MKSHAWDPSKLEELRKKEGLSKTDLALNTEIGYQTILRILKGESAPNTKTLQALADYFHVTTDYFLSSSGDNKSENADSSIKKQNRHAKRITSKPYPYNLLYDLYIDSEFAPPETITQDQMDGLLAVLSKLSDPIRNDLRLCYELKYKMKDIAKADDVTPSRVQQRISLALSVLIQPSFFDLIHYGLLGNQIRQKDLQLKLTTARIALLEEEIKKLKKEHFLKSLSISDLNLSIRSYNCLTRNLPEVRTLDDLYQYVAANGIDGLGKIKNMGVKSVKEILGILRDHGYPVDEIPSVAAWPGKTIYPIVRHKGQVKADPSSSDNTADESKQKDDDTYTLIFEDKDEEECSDAADDDTYTIIFEDDDDEEPEQESPVKRKGLFGTKLFAKR